MKPAHSFIPRILLVAALLVLATSAPTFAATTATETSKPAAATKVKAKSVEEAEAAAAKRRDADAARRAKDSKFEAEKLDQAPFQENAEAKAKDSSGGGSIIRMLFGLAVVIGAIFGVQWLLKKWAAAKLDGAAGTSGLIDVVSTTVLSQGRALHLVRVADELVLVGATEHSISRLGALDARVLVGDLNGTVALPSATRHALPAAGQSSTSGFHGMLEGSLAGGAGATAAVAATAPVTEGPFLKRFIENLRISTAR